MDANLTIFRKKFFARILSSIYFMAISDAKFFSTEQISGKLLSSKLVHFVKKSDTPFFENS